MIFHDYYGEVSAEDLERFVSAQELGRLVTVGEEGIPHIGLYPFVTFDGGFDLHLVRADEQVLDLKARPRCVFELDEVLGVIPSYWVHPQYAGAATAYHRTVIFECTSVARTCGERFCASLNFTRWSVISRRTAAMCAIAPR